MGDHLSKIAVALHLNDFFDFTDRFSRRISHRFWPPRSSHAPEMRTTKHAMDEESFISRGYLRCIERLHCVILNVGLDNVQTTKVGFWILSHGQIFRTRRTPHQTSRTILKATP